MRVAYIVGWCNGSIKGSEPLDAGSIPAPATIQERGVSDMLKRLTSVVILCALLSCFLMIPAHAAPLDGEGKVSFSSASFLAGVQPSGYVTNVSYSSNSQQVFEKDNFFTDARYFAYRSLSIPLNNVQSTIVVSFSFFMKGDSSCKWYSSGDPTVQLSYTDSNGTLKVNNEGSFNTFTPSISSSLTSTGITVTGTFKGSEISPISSFNLSWPTSICYGYSAKGADISLYVPSFRVIQTDAPSSDLAQLQDIAKGIAESNQILSAMYGDILAVCNSIYERTGSILEAQNLSNQYFASIVPYIKSIDTRINRIYKLLGEQFSLLISTIQTESDDIQATINAAIDKMIAYLDSAFNSAVNPALPGTSQDITTNNGTVHNAESDYQSTAAERFESISAGFSGFDGSILSGVALGGSLFQRLWNVLGDYVILYTFPLTLSICLVVVGRLSRNASRSGGGKKKDGDDS